jgi:hypothetical protein
VPSTVQRLRSVASRVNALPDHYHAAPCCGISRGKRTVLIKVSAMRRTATWFASGLVRGLNSWAFCALPIAMWLAGCGTVCDEVVDEAEANGCALSPADSEETAVSQECEGVLERRANCLLDLTDNVCAITEAELSDLEACYAAEPLE